ncbi:MAG: hypothetical protein D6775_08270, partial [Caldilineae bacterium]
GGQVGGSRPVGHNLWQDWLLGWRHPRVIRYDDPEARYVLGRARYTPPDAEDGLIIQLPPKEFRVENKAGAGQGWWSGSGNSIDHRVSRVFDLTAAGDGLVFSFDAYWDIEQDWDYGYLEISTDGGNTWTTLPDRDGLLVDSNPNGNNLGWGLTGRGQGRLRFDLSAYRGRSVVLRFRYLTDTTTATPGWWVDNLSLDDASGNLYANALEEGFADWDNQGWVVTPFSKLTDQFYLLEWRDDNGFDRSLLDAYQIVFQDESTRETKINRLPATTPGLLILYRDTDEPFDLELKDSLARPPSYGPKYGLLVVDAHPWPLRFDTTSANYQNGWVGVPVSGRAMPGDALFGRVPTLPWSARLGYDFDTFTWQETPIEFKSWPSRPAVPAFHDALGYTPGFFYPGTGSLIYLHDWDASAVLPARGDYSAAVTWPDGTPNPALYGIEIAPGRALGTGHPGDSQVQYGLHVEVLESSDERGVIRVWNALYELEGAGQPESPSAVNGQQVDFSFAVRNVGSTGDFFAFVPLPTGTRYVPGSVSGDFFPIGGPTAADIAALARMGPSLPAEWLQPAGTEDVAGFGYLGHLDTADTMTGGFSVTLDGAPTGQPLEARLTFYQDGAPFRVFTATVDVQNTPPQITLPAPSADLTEGDTLQIDGSFSDPDPDTWTATVDYGDGQGPRPLALNPDHTFSLEHRYGNEGVFQLTVSVGDGRTTTQAVIPITVTNAVPQITLSAPPPIDEGDTVLLTGMFSDPGEDTWSATVDFGDGSAAEELSVSAGQVFTLEHRYEQNGLYTLTLRVGDGTDEGTAAVGVSVDNVPPRVDAITDALLGVGDLYQAQGRFRDPGADVWTATVDYGEGAGPEPLVLEPDQSFRLEHRYAAAGVYTLTVTVWDE